MFDKNDYLINLKKGGFVIRLPIFAKLLEKLLLTRNFMTYVYVILSKYNLYYDLRQD